MKHCASPPAADQEERTRTDELSGGAALHGSVFAMGTPRFLYVDGRVP